MAEQKKCDDTILEEGLQTEVAEEINEDSVQDGDSVQAEETSEEKEDKKSTKAKEKAAKKKDKSRGRIEELEDRVKRQMAEFENFRKRSEKEKSAMFETGAKSVIEKMLPVIDNFERGLEAVPENEKNGGFCEGMQMIYKQLLTELESLDVRPIEALGTEFDPDLHNAVMQVESEEYETGIIAQELQKGYTYRDTVVRHSMVGVVQ